MKKISFYTLGCKLNFSETSSIARTLQEHGYQRVPYGEKADIHIINTCTVTNNADKDCRKAVRDIRKINPDTYIAVVGCYAQIKPEEIANIEGVNAVLGSNEKFRMLELLNDFEITNTPQIHASHICEDNVFNNAFSSNDRTRTFFKIQDGCDYKCTYCTIPKARGKSRSNKINETIKTAQEIANTDTKEVILTGVNIGDFGIQDGSRTEDFHALIKELDEIDGIERYRISSCEPNLLTNEIIDFVSTSKRFAPHLHIPLQSGCNKILKAMKRRYMRDVFEQRVLKVKEVMPNACIGADVIVGFPGETDDDFNTTYEFIANLPISYLHVFSYSERDDTEAAAMGEIIPKKIRSERSKKLRDLSVRLMKTFTESQEGKKVTVLFENDVHDGLIKGFTEHYIRVEHEYSDDLINTVVRGKLAKGNGNVQLLITNE